MKKIAVIIISFLFVLGCTHHHYYLIKLDTPNKTEYISIKQKLPKNEWTIAEKELLEIAEKSARKADSVFIIRDKLNG